MFVGMSASHGCRDQRTLMMTCSLFPPIEPSHRSQLSYFINQNNLSFSHVLFLFVD